MRPPSPSNPPSPDFPEGTVTVRLHRRKPQHILMDRRDVDPLLAAEVEMQRTENKHLTRKLQAQAQYIRKLEDVLESEGHDMEHIRRGV